MGQYDDIWYEISESVNELGLKKEFEEELDKLKCIPQYQYTGLRDKWDVAYQNILEAYHKNKKKNA